MYKSLQPYDMTTKRVIALLIITNTISAVLSLFFPFATRVLIDNLILLNRDQYLLLWLAICILVTLAIKLFNFYCVGYLGDKSSTLLANKIRKKLMKHLLELPVNAYNKLDSGMLFNSIIAETNMAATSFLNYKVTLVIRIVQACLYESIIFFIHWKIGILTLCIIPIYVYLSKNNVQIFNKSIYDERNKIDQMVKTFQVISSNKKQIHLFGKLEFFLSRFIYDVDAWGKARVKYNFFYLLLRTLPGTLNEITIFLVYGIGAMLVIRNSFSLGTLILLGEVSSLLFSQLTTIVNVRVDVKNTKPIFERINSILFLEYEDTLPEKESNYLRIQDSNVSVEDRLLFHINDFSMVDNGICLLQADNGVGKTFFFDSMLGLVKGMNMGEKIQLPISKIGYMCNPNFLFEDSVYMNIFIDDKFDMEFIETMKNYFYLDFLDTQITLSPINLSLGQQQKICLMRFFYINRNKEYWFVDEPTTNLDVDSIKGLKRYLVKMAESKKILLVSHDDYFSDVAKAIYRIQNLKLSKVE